MNEQFAIKPSLEDYQFINGGEWFDDVVRKSKTQWLSIDDCFELIESWFLGQCRIVLSRKHLYTQFGHNEWCFQRALKTRCVSLYRFSFLNSIEKVGISDWKIIKKESSESEFYNSISVVIYLDIKLTDSEKEYINTQNSSIIADDIIECFSCASDGLNKFEDRVESIFKYINDQTIARYEPGGEEFNNSMAKINEMLKN